MAVVPPLIRAGNLRNFPILAVMTRAALGHTGRRLVAAKPMVAAYLLTTQAAAARVFAPMVAPAMPQAT